MNFEERMNEIDDKIGGFVHPEDSRWLFSKLREAVDVLTYYSQLIPKLDENVNAKASNFLALLHNNTSEIK